MPLYADSFTVLDSVDSTNNYAMARVHAGLAKHGDAFFSYNQTSGKGQRGKHWYSGNGENIALSIMIEPKAMQLSEQFKLSMAVAIAACNFFTKYADDETKIKWPNDIYWRDRKAGGILIENIIGKSDAGNAIWKNAVVGIGLNINEKKFEQELLNVVSLKQITGKEFDVVTMAKELHQTIMNKINDVGKTDAEILLQQYNNLLFKKDCIVKLKKGNIEFSTTIKSVTINGQLFTTDVVDNYFSFGEVEWLL